MLLHVGEKACFANMYPKNLSTNMELKRNEYDLAVISKQYCVRSRKTDGAFIFTL